MTDIPKTDVRIRINEMVSNVYQFLKEEYAFMKLYNTDNCDLKALSAIQTRTAKATGLSARSITYLMKQKRNNLKSDLQNKQIDVKKRLKKKEVDNIKDKIKEKLKREKTKKVDNIKDKIKKKLKRGKKREVDNIKDKTAKKWKWKVYTSENWIYQKEKSKPKNEVGKLVNERSMERDQKKIMQCSPENGLHSNAEHDINKQSSQINECNVKFVKQEVKAEFADLMEETDNEALTANFTEEINKLNESIVKYINQEELQIEYSDSSTQLLEKLMPSRNEYTSTEFNTGNYNIFTNIKQEVDIEYSDSDSI